MLRLICIPGLFFLAEHVLIYLVFDNRYFNVNNLEIYSWPIYIFTVIKCDLYIIVRYYAQDESSWICNDVSLQKVWYLLSNKADRNQRKAEGVTD